MEICKDCIHEEVCVLRAYDMLQNKEPYTLLSECDRFKAKEQKIDIYKIADTITSTVKQVVLANLRNICDEEGD